MSISVEEHKGQGSVIVQELVADVVILMPQSVAPLGLDDMCVCNRKVIYYYYITLPSITSTSKKFHSITITGKSVYYILQLHIAITTSL